MEQCGGREDIVSQCTLLSHLYPREVSGRYLRCGERVAAPVVFFKDDHFQPLQVPLMQLLVIFIPVNLEHVLDEAVHVINADKQITLTCADEIHCGKANGRVLAKKLYTLRNQNQFLYTKILELILEFANANKLTSRIIVYFPTYYHSYLLLFIGIWDEFPFIAFHEFDILKCIKVIITHVVDEPMDIIFVASDTTINLPVTH